MKTFIAILGFILISAQLSFASGQEKPGYDTPSECLVFDENDNVMEELQYKSGILISSENDQTYIIEGGVKIPGGMQKIFGIVSGAYIIGGGSQIWRMEVQKYENEFDGTLYVTTRGFAGQETQSYRILCELKK